MAESMLFRRPARARPSYGSTHEPGVSRVQHELHSRPQNELQLDLPALAEDRARPACWPPGLLVNFTLGVVPQQLAFEVDGDRAEHQPFGVRPGDAEVGAGRRAALAGADPVARMRGVVAASARAGRAWQVRRRAACIPPTANPAAGRRLRRVRWCPDSLSSRRRCSCSRCLAVVEAHRL